MKKLYRSETDRKLAGVCGGPGEHFDVDPVIFRILFVVTAFMGGFGLLLYMVMWLAVHPKSKLSN